MDSANGLQTSLWRGCPIGILRAPRLHAAPPERFAGLRVLLRPSAPRHPPCTLLSLFSLFLCASLCVCAWLLHAPACLLPSSPMLRAGRWACVWHARRWWSCCACISVPLLLSCSRQN